MKIKGQEREKSLNVDWYFSSSYFEKKQILSQINQFELIKKHSGKKVLEIGPGNGLTSYLIKASGFDLKTFDINENLKPDVVGDITKIDEYFGNSEFDTILCCEVLEHIPLEDFERTIKKLINLISQSAIISLPQCKKNLIDIDLSFRFLHSRSFNFNLFRRFGNHKIADLHYWEVDSSPASSAKQIESIFKKYADLIETRSYYSNRYHNFYVIRKRQ